MKYELWCMLFGFLVGSVLWSVLYARALRGKDRAILECSKIAYRQAWSHGSDLGAELNSVKIQTEILKLLDKRKRNTNWKGV